MKNFFLAVLTFLYISTSAGATLHMHYCMGKLADWGLGDHESKTCSNCGMEETENGCCKHEYKFVKNDTDQKITELSVQLILLIAVTLPPAFVELPSNDFPFLTLVNPVNHAPPQNTSIAVYIRNCVFLI